MTEVTQSNHNTERHCARSYRVKPQYKKALCQKFESNHNIKRGSVPEVTESNHNIKRGSVTEVTESNHDIKRGSVPEVTESNHNTERHRARSYRVKPQYKKALCQKLQRQTTI